jgi:hypothetical protein
MAPWIPKDAKWGSTPIFFDGPVVRATAEAEKQLVMLSRAQQ